MNIMSHHDLLNSLLWTPWWFKKNTKCSLYYEILNKLFHVYESLIIGDRVFVRTIIKLLRINYMIVWGLACTSIHNDIHYVIFFNFKSLRLHIHFFLLRTSFKLSFRRNSLSPSHLGYTHLWQIKPVHNLIVSDI